MRIPANQSSTKTMPMRHALCAETHFQGLAVEFSQSHGRSIACLVEQVLALNLRLFMSSALISPRFGLPPIHSQSVVQTCGL